MEEAEKETVETPVETTEEPASVAEEKVVKVDMTEANKSIAALAEVVGKLAKKVAEQDEAQAPAAETAEDEIPAPVTDETVGEVGTEEEKPAETEEGFILERAETGKGYQIFRDYSKSSGKFNRLCR